LVSASSDFVRSDLQRASASRCGFKYVFDKALEGKSIDRMDQNKEIFTRYMNDKDFRKVVAELQRKQVYEQVRAEAANAPTAGSAR
jgi:hypothetical protein